MDLFAEDSVEHEPNRLSGCADVPDDLEQSYHSRTGENVRGLDNSPYWGSSKNLCPGLPPCGPTRKTPLLCLIVHHDDLC
jgi:hypothetical protein